MLIKLELELVLHDAFPQCVTQCQSGNTPFFYHPGDQLVQQEVGAEGNSQLETLGLPF